MSELDFNNSTFRFSLQWRRFQEYSQKYLSLQDILAKDEYLNKLNDENRITHFNNGNQQCRHTFAVGYNYQNAI